MTEIEKKALALAIETRVGDRYRLCPDPTLVFGLWEALCRAIEQHEAFRQEVSDTVESLCNTVLSHHDQMREMLSRRFIIPRPDPLVEALEAALWDVSNVKLTDQELRTISNIIGKIVGGYEKP